MNLFDKYGTVSLAAISPEEVAALTDAQQKLLAVLIEKVEAREAAQARAVKAVRAVTDANAEQRAALEAHALANPAPTPLEAHRAAIAAYRPL